MLVFKLKVLSLASTFKCIIQRVRSPPSQAPCFPCLHPVQCENPVNFVGHDAKSPLTLLAIMLKPPSPGALF